MSIYDPYYAVTKMTKFSVDPRARRRATSRAVVTGGLGIIISLITAQFVIAWLLRFDPMLGGFIVPGKLFFWIGAFYARTYPSAAFTRHIHDVFTRGFFVLGAGIVVTLFAAIVEYFRSRSDRTGLSTEKGDARWATPEEIAAATPDRDDDDNLLPEGYDLHKGFALAAKTRNSKIKARAAVAFQEKREHSILTEDDADPD